MTLKFLTGTILGSILALLVLAANALAAPICTDRRALVTDLEKTYSETPVSIGLGTSIGLETNGSVIEVFASSTGTFTIILTNPNGFSCVMAAGENWEALPKKLAGMPL